MTKAEPIGKLICESCGADFSCGAQIGQCWCFEIDLKAETLAKLPADFKSCLCSSCLKKLALNDSNNANKTTS